MFVLEVVKTRRWGFGEQVLFSKPNDCVDYIADDLTRNKEEKSSYQLTMRNKDTYRPLIIRYKDYEGGKDHADFYRIINGKVLEWVRLNEAFIESVRKIKD